MTINHIDQLAEWWENAEDAPASPGDRIIERHVCERDEDTCYTIGVHREGMRGLIGKSGTRILARAPKPKPTWHDAPAVTAKGREDWDHVEAFSRNDDYDPPRWIDNQGITYTAEQLSDVTPLIEAKVTDETARTVLDRYYETETGHDWPEDTIALMRLAVTAALGLESV